MVSVVKGLVNYASFSAVDAETIYSMLSTWSNKFNMILLAVSTGIVVSLVPEITEFFVKKQKEEINKKVEQSFSMLLYFIVPMSFGICFLSKAIWTLFYGASKYGASVLSYYIFVGLVISVFTTAITILEVLKDYKGVLICLVAGVLTKIVLNNSLLYAFTNFSLPPYYGFITATILGYLMSLVLCLILLYFKFGISFESVLKRFVDIVCGAMLMIVVLILISLVIPTYSNVRLMNLLIICFYGMVGAIVYFVYAGKLKLTKNIFGNGLIKSVNRILFRK